MDFFSVLAGEGKLVWWRHERLPLPLRYLTNDADHSLSDELSKALKLAESVAITLRDGVRRLAVLLLIPYCDSKSKNPDYFTPHISQNKRFDAAEKQAEIEEANGFKRTKKRPNPIDERVRGFAPELRYWSRLENEFRQMIVGLAKARGDAEEPPEGWAAEMWSEWIKALRRVTQQAFDEVVGGIGANARNLRAAALAAAWFNAEISSQTYGRAKNGGDESDLPDMDAANDASSANAEGDGE